jgi:hypothetical protein
MIKLAVASVLVCAAAGVATAKPSGGGGGHGGGGGGHAGGGGGHGGGGHVGGGGGRGGSMHIGGGGGRGGGGVHIGRAAHGGARVSAHVSSRLSAGKTSNAVSQRGGRFGRDAHGNTPANTNAHVTPSTDHTPATTVRSAATTAARSSVRADPRVFAANRRFAGNPAFRPFLNAGWHPHHHLGWIGPFFWPYAYGDLFYYALWPDDYGYVDPFWYYGYGDIYTAIFSPNSYDDYVQGPGAPERMTALSQGMAQSCGSEAAEVTGWPVDQIQAAVQPSQQQNALLDQLGNAVVKASDEIKAQCPTSVSFTPTARLSEMQQRLQALVTAVNIVDPALGKFYDSLSDEQKARFNDMAPPGADRPSSEQKSAANPQSQCDASALSWPTDQIDRTVRLDDAQRAKLDALQAAASHAADAIKAACPTEEPATPPGRLEAVGTRLQSMLQAVETVQPALAAFYDSLSDDQKARFNGMGKQLFAANQE